MLQLHRHFERAPVTPFAPILQGVAFFVRSLPAGRAAAVQAAVEAVAAPHEPSQVRGQARYCEADLSSGPAAQHAQHVQQRTATCHDFAA